MIDRKGLFRQAVAAAVELRDKTGFDQFGPADPYLAAQKLGVKVLFLDVSMEGFYFKGAAPRILVSALRPLPRRAFTCAHELGHHHFGHGSTMDQLQADERADSHKPEEILANGVASFFLMPTVGIRGAFARRGWTIAKPTPLQLYTVACEFGVGYDTLLNHLSYTLKEIGSAHTTELDRWGPQRVRQQLIKDDFDSFVVVDAESLAQHCDIEQGAAIILPLDVDVDGRALEHLGSYPSFDLYRAVKRGKATASWGKKVCTIRVQPKAYVGAAVNRFEEDPDEDD